MISDTKTNTQQLSPAAAAAVAACEAKEQWEQQQACLCNTLQQLYCTSATEKIL